jgi:predicted ABC-type transport system involved in lysophospholipase L1 biosynthesis ATPase subunit
MLWSVICHFRTLRGMSVDHGTSAEECVQDRVAAGPLIEFCGVVKTYRSGALEYPALRGIDLQVGRGEMVSIVGPSGSGKSTILNLVTGIDRPTDGSVVVDGRRVDEMSEEALAAWRGVRVGIVFQFFQLLPTLTALENAMLPMEFAGLGSARTRVESATRNLEMVGLGDKLRHVPSELSGGEQQRVAIARALACEPVLLVGDEPTGNLDSETAVRMFDLLAELNARGTTVLYVTHDAGLAAKAHRTVVIRDGRIDDSG